MHAHRRDRPYYYGQSDAPRRMHAHRRDRPCYYLTGKLRSSEGPSRGCRGARWLASCDFSNPARGPTDLPPEITGVAAHSPLVEKGNEIQRCWRLYEFLYRARNGPDLLIRRVSSIWYS